MGDTLGSLCRGSERPQNSEPPDLGPTAGRRNLRGVRSVPKLVYDFTEGNKDLRDLLGGKGANLAEMTNLGLPVPPGFIITTDACRYYLAEGRVPDGLAAEVDEHLAQLEAKIGRRRGGHAHPPLGSGRGGGPFFHAAR